MSDRFEKLLSIATDREQLDLKILHNAEVQCCKEYKEDPSAHKKKDWDAAREGLQECIERLWTKYFVKGELLGSRLEVFRHLKARGFKVSKSKVYKDADAGLLRTQPDGSVLMSDVSLYIKAELQNKAVNTGDELEGMNRRKLQLEIEGLEKKNARQDFELSVAMSKYIPKEDFEMELAARLGVLETGLKHFFQANINEWVFMVGGKANKSGELLEILTGKLDELLNEYARADEFQVIFVDEDGDAASR